MAENQLWNIIFLLTVRMFQNKYFALFIKVTPAKISLLLIREISNNSNKRAFLRKILNV